jgi:hypothetical protein
MGDILCLCLVMLFGLVVFAILVLLEVVVAGESLFGDVEVEVVG